MHPETELGSSKSKKASQESKYCKETIIVDLLKLEQADLDQKKASESTQSEQLKLTQHSELSLPHGNHFAMLFTEGTVTIHLPTMIETLFGDKYCSLDVQLIKNAPFSFMRLQNFPFPRNTITSQTQFGLTDIQVLRYHLLVDKIYMQTLVTNLNLEKFNLSKVGVGKTDQIRMKSIVQTAYPIISPNGRYPIHAEFFEALDYENSLEGTLRVRLRMKEAQEKEIKRTKEVQEKERVEMTKTRPKGTIETKETREKVIHDLLSLNSNLEFEIEPEEIQSQSPAYLDLECFAPDWTWNRSRYLTKKVNTVFLTALSEWCILDPSSEVPREIYPKISKNNQYILQFPESSDPQQHAYLEGVIEEVDPCNDRDIGCFVYFNGLGRTSTNNQIWELTIRVNQIPIQLVCLRDNVHKNDFDFITQDKDPSGRIPKIGQKIYALCWLQIFDAQDKRNLLQRTPPHSYAVSRETIDQDPSINLSGPAEVNKRNIEMRIGRALYENPVIATPKMQAFGYQYTDPKQILLPRNLEGKTQGENFRGRRKLIDLLKRLQRPYDPFSEASKNKMDSLNETPSKRVSDLVAGTQAWFRGAPRYFSGILGMLTLSETFQLLCASKDHSKVIKELLQNNPKIWKNWFKQIKWNLRAHFKSNNLLHIERQSIEKNVPYILIQLPSNEPFSDQIDQINLLKRYCRLLKIHPKLIRSYTKEKNTLDNDIELCDFFLLSTTIKDQLRTKFNSYTYPCSLCNTGVSYGANLDAYTCLTDFLACENCIQNSIYYATDLFLWGISTEHCSDIPHFNRSHTQSFHKDDLEAVFDKLYTNFPRKAYSEPLSERRASKYQTLPERVKKIIQLETRTIVSCSRLQHNELTTNYFLKFTPKPPAVKPKKSEVVEKPEQPERHEKPEKLEKKETNSFLI